MLERLAASRLQFAEVFVSFESFCSAVKRLLGKGKPTRAFQWLSALTVSWMGRFSIFKKVQSDSSYNLTFDTLIEIELFASFSQYGT